MEWNSRFKNKAFWIALASSIILLAQQLGSTFLPDNSMEIVNTLLSIFVLLGVIVDPTTPGITDSKKK